MAAVIAARFDSFATANSAAHALFAYGISPDDVSVFFAPDAKGTSAADDLDLDPRKFMVRFQAQANVAGLATLGAILGAALVMTFGGPALAMAGAAAAGAFGGSWVGALWLASRSRALRAVRQSRYALLTAQVSLSQEQDVIELLLDAGSEAVERAQGRWLHGQWVDSDLGSRAKEMRTRSPSSSSPARESAFRSRQRLLG